MKSKAIWKVKEPEPLTEKDLENCIIQELQRLRHPKIDKRVLLCRACYKNGKSRCRFLEIKKPYICAWIP